VRSPESQRVAHSPVHKSEKERGREGARKRKGEKERKGGRERDGGRERETEGGREGQWTHHECVKHRPEVEVLLLFLGRGVQVRRAASATEVIN
jgi:hypothetical protein